MINACRGKEILNSKSNRYIEYAWVRDKERIMRCVIIEIIEFRQEFRLLRLESSFTSSIVRNVRTYVIPGIQYASGPRRPVGSAEAFVTRFSHKYIRSCLLMMDPEHPSRNIRSGKNRVTHCVIPRSFLHFFQAVRSTTPTNSLESQDRVILYKQYHSLEENWILQNKNKPSIMASQHAVNQSAECNDDDRQFLFVIRHGDRWDYANPEVGNRKVLSFHKVCLCWSHRAVVLQKKWKKSSASRTGDSPLSTLGHIQAQETGKFLDSWMNEKGFSADDITWLSSPFLRCLQTSNEALNSFRKVNVDTLPIFPEYSKFTILLCFFFEGRGKTSVFSNTYWRPCRHLRMGWPWWSVAQGSTFLWRAQTLFPTLRYNLREFLHPYNAR